MVCACTVLEKFLFHLEHFSWINLWLNCWRGPYLQGFTYLTKVWDGSDVENQDLMRKKIAKHVYVHLYGFSRLLQSNNVNPTKFAWSDDRNPDGKLLWCDAEKSVNKPSHSRNLKNINSIFNRRLPQRSRPDYLRPLLTTCWQVRTYVRTDRQTDGLNDQPTDPSTNWGPQRDYKQVKIERDRHVIWSTVVPIEPCSTIWNILGIAGSWLIASRSSFVLNSISSMAISMGLDAIYNLSIKWTKINKC